jgi:signal transduction histidine kinase
MRGALGREWIWALLQAPRWMTWALVTPLIFGLARRVPVTRTRPARAIGIHLAAAMGISAVIESIWLFVTFELARSLNPNELLPPTVAVAMISSVLSRLAGGAITYAAVLGVATVLLYQDRLRERDLAASQLETQLAQAQLHALKMQVHPHFLFNTLHAVTVLIRENPNAAIRMVARLGDMLRLTLSRAHATEVSLGRELEILTQYLEIERVRFNDRLAVAYDIDPGVLPASVPDLILQPLVENAIKHGVGPRAGPGRIAVRARRAGDFLEVEIEDNGSGVPRGREAIEGIGLSTTRARLKRMYGDEQELVLTSPAQGGCIARLRIPWRLTQESSSPADLLASAPRTIDG